MLAVELECQSERLLICNIYQSPASHEEEDKSLFSFITDVSQNYKGKKLFIGDFNYNDVNWETWETEFAGSKSNEFIEMLRDNFLFQVVDRPNRARGSDKPHILDLVLTDELDLVQSIKDLGPLGKSDHSMLYMVCCIHNCKHLYDDKLNYSKGNYDEFRQYMDIDWDDLFGKSGNDIDVMWDLFKSIIESGISRFIPKVSKFGTWKKNKWKMPLNKETRSLIKQKRKMWHKFINSNNPHYLNRFKDLRNKLRCETRKIQKLEQSEVAKSCKNNPK